MRRFVFGCVVLVGATSVASASFDLMYLPLSSGAIQRYDPVWRLNMGIMPQIAGAQHVYYRGGQTGAITISSGSNYRMNYVTNTLGNYLNFNVGSISRDGATVASVSGTTLNNINLTTGLVTGVNLGSSTFIAIQDGSRYYGVTGIGTTSLTTQIYSATGSQVATSTQTTLSTIIGFTAPSVITNLAGKSLMVGTYKQNDGRNFVYRRIMDTSSITTFSTDLSNFGFSTASNVVVVPAHSGFYMVGRNAGGTTQFTFFDNDGGGFLVGSWSESFVLNPSMSSVGMVVAPEPGSLAVLGLAFGLMVRRRRK